MKREWLLSAGRSLLYLLVMAIAMRAWKPVSPTERTQLTSPSRTFTVAPVPSMVNEPTPTPPPADRRSEKQKWLDQKLADAVINHDERWARRWMKRGGSLNGRGSYIHYNDEAPLWWMIEHGDLDGVRLLLRLGADVNKPLGGYGDEGGSEITAFENALNGGHGMAPMPAMMRLLLEAGADVRRAYKDGGTPLSRALVLLSGRYYNRDDDGDEARGEMADLMRLMLRRGALVNGPDVAGRTPLHEACLWEEENDAFRAARFLLQNGARVRVADRDGVTPLMEAIAGRSSYEDDESEQELYGRYHLRLARLLLERGAQVEARDAQGRTVFMRAALAPDDDDRKLRALRYLLQHGSKINDRDAQGKTPLLHAVDAYYLSGDTDPKRALAAIRWLLESGADVRARDRQGRGAIELARGEWNVLQLLKSHVSKAGGAP